MKTNTKMIIGYVLTALGLVLAGFSGVATYIQAAYRYQTENHLEQKIKADDFILTVNADQFMYPGVVIVIIGMTIAITTAMRWAERYREQQASQAS